jgi:hypothetical protein
MMTRSAGHLAFNNAAAKMILRLNNVRRNRRCFVARDLVRRGTDITMVASRKWTTNVTETATIIDLDAYRAARRQAASQELQRQPWESALEIPPFGFYFFWPVFAWIPISSLLAPAATEEYT